MCTVIEENTFDCGCDYCTGFAHLGVQSVLLTGLDPTGKASFRVTQMSGKQRALMLGMGVNYLNKLRRVGILRYYCRDRIYIKCAVRQRSPKVSVSSKYQSQYLLCKSLTRFTFKMPSYDTGFVMYAMEKSGTPCTKLLNPSASQHATSSSGAPAPVTSQTSKEEVRYSTESELLVKGMA